MRSLSKSFAGPYLAHFATRELRLPVILLLPSVPEVPEEFYRIGDMARVMIVCEREDFSDALILDKPPQHDHPIPQFTLPVDNRFIRGATT